MLCKIKSTDKQTDVYVYTYTYTYLHMQTHIYNIYNSFGGCKK